MTDWTEPWNYDNSMTTIKIIGLLLFTLVHAGAIVIVLTIFASKEYSTRQANQNNWRDDLVGKPKSVLNQRKILHFLSKAASLEPLYPVDQSCSKAER